MKKGYTLIELICVVSIFSLLCMAAYPSYSSFLVRDRLKLSTQKLIEDLKYAKMYAISHDTSSVNVLFQAGEGVSNGFNSYRIYLPAAVGNMTLKEVNLPKGVMICPRGEGTTFNTDNKISFKPAGNVAPFACTIALKDLNTGEKKYITLTIGFTRIMESDGIL